MPYMLFANISQHGSSNQKAFCGGGLKSVFFNKHYDDDDESSEPDFHTLIYNKPVFETVRKLFQRDR